MKLIQLDNDRLTGTQPIRHALRWLQSALDAKATTWRVEQHTAASDALEGARRHLKQDVLAIVATPADDAVTRIADLGARDWEAFEHREDPPQVPKEYRLTLEEVKDLSAMVWGAPASDEEAAKVYMPLLQMYEQLRVTGAKPKDPADMTKQEARAHWLQFDTMGSMIQHVADESQVATDGVLEPLPGLQPVFSRAVGGPETWHDKAKRLAGEYAHCYAFVGDDTMPRKQQELFDHLATCIPLTPAEVQSGSSRVKWAAGLIRQLPEDHDGRNSWLMNYGGGL